MHDWKLVTEETMGATLIKNLIWLRKGKILERHLHGLDLHAQFLDALEFYAKGERTLASIIRAAATSTHLPYTDGILLFKHSVLNKKVRLDIKTHEFKLSGLRPLLTFSRASSVTAAALKVA